MRTTKRFSPNVLDRFRRLERGTGTNEAYIPWHRVSRSDPASRGRSRLQTLNSRHIELLSDVESTALFFATRLLTKENDLREQFPLSLESSPHELSAYDARHIATTYPGTLQIAKELNIKHPMTHGDGRSAPWVMTTDLLIMQKTGDNNRTLLAVSVKNTNTLSKRAKALLEIERTYWLTRKVPWLLLTPCEYHPQVAETLHRTWQWALDSPVTETQIEAAKATIRRYQGHSLTYVLEKLVEQFGDMTLAQCAVWQAIWKGRIPVDLRRGWRPHSPLQIINQTEFDQLNPILMRRSAWI